MNWVYVRVRVHVHVHVKEVILMSHEQVTGSGSCY
jgi:hypothetical protein